MGWERENIKLKRHEERVRQVSKEMVSFERRNSTRILSDSEAYYAHILTNEVTLCCLFKKSPSQAQPWLEKWNSHHHIRFPTHADVGADESRCFLSKCESLPKDHISSLHLFKPHIRPGASVQLDFSLTSLSHLLDPLSLNCKLWNTVFFS